MSVSSVSHARRPQNVHRRHVHACANVPPCTRILSRNAWLLPSQALCMCAVRFALAPARSAFLHTFMSIFYALWCKIQLFYAHAHTLPSIRAEQKHTHTHSLIIYGHVNLMFVYIARIQTECVCVHENVMHINCVHARRTHIKLYGAVECAAAGPSDQAGRTGAL